MNDISCLVFGGQGSLGSKVVNKLLSKNVRTISIDKHKLDKYSKSTNCHHSINFLDTDSLKVLANKIQDNSCHGLFLAGKLDNTFDHLSIQSNISSNMLSLSNIITVFRKKIRHFTFISSISVYGIPDNNPIPENTNISPVTLYGTMKASGEFLSSVLCERYHIPITIFRPTQIYGVKSAINSLPHKIIDKAAKGYHLKVNTRENCIRDYLNIDDFLDLMVLHNTLQIEGHYNIGSNKPITIGELIKTVSNRFKVDFVVDRDKTNQNNSFDQYLNNSKIEKIYNFQPKSNIKNWLLEVDPYNQF